MSLLLWKGAKFLGAVVLVVMAFNATIGESDTRSLGVTTATIGGQSTDIVISDMIPAFFNNIGDGGNDADSGN